MNPRRYILAWVIFAGTLAAASLLSAHPVRADCQARGIDAMATVAEVFDGDTVKLRDGRHVRLIGLDTPERGHDGHAPQPYAVRATDALKAILRRTDDHIQLRLGRERQDHYGRELAHLYTSDGDSINAALLRRGFATALTVPPNTWNLQCYRQAEARARKARLGIWSLPRYQVMDTTALDRGARGFHRIVGRVEHIGHSRRSIWVDFVGDVALRIDRRDAANFPAVDFDALMGQRIVARGWLYRHDQELRMRVRHPAALEQIH